MHANLQAIFDVSRYQDAEARERGYAVYGLVLALMAVFTIFATVRSDVVTGQNLWGAFGNEPLWTIIIPVFYVVAIAAFLLTRYGQLHLSSLGPIAMWYAAAVLATLEEGFVHPASGLTLAAFVLLGGLLYRQSGVLLATLAALISLLIGIGLRVNLADPPGSSADQLHFITIGLQVVAVAGLIYWFLRTSQRVQHTSKSESAEGRLKLATITAAVTQYIAQQASLDAVLQSAVERIVSSYPAIYQVQIFLVDASGEHARLAAGTGNDAQRLLEQGHALEVGSQNVIGRVMRSGESIMARAHVPGVHRSNPLLSETVVEAALPLRIGATVIGVLDLQSKVERDVLEGNLPIFQSLADHLAVAIDKARLFEKNEQRLRENEALAGQAQKAMEEVQALNTQLSGQAWDQYLARQETALSLNMDFARNTVRTNDELTPTLTEAMKFNYVVEQHDDSKRVIAIPLRVRGHVIGALEFELDEHGNFAPEHLELVQEVGERFGMAVENNRLFEESQRVARREALVNQISTRLQLTHNIETTLTEAVLSLGDALQAHKVSVRLGRPPSNEDQSDAEVQA